MGADPVDSLRQMKNMATDPYSRGRNFAGHFSVRKWNVVPVTLADRGPVLDRDRHRARAAQGTGAKGITIVQGGDAGTAEGDFATALVWSSRKGSELPMLMIVTNNQYGISTPYEGQHGDDQISDRGKAFGMPTAMIDGNDPEASYAALQEGDGLRAHRAEAVPARGDGLASARPLVGERREPREGRDRLPRRASSRSSRSASS